MIEQKLSERNPKTLKELYVEDYSRICLICKTVYKSGKVKIEWNDECQGGDFVEMCSCGSNLVGYIIESQGKLHFTLEPRL